MNLKNKEQQGSLEISAKIGLKSAALINQILWLTYNPLPVKLI